MIRCSTVLFKRRHHGSGFTLIELLVVVAIIALLIAILLPSLGAAKARSRTVACRSNLKQIFMGSSLYAEAYNNKLPDTQTLGSNMYRRAPGLKNKKDSASLPETFGLAAVLDSLNIHYGSAAYPTGGDGVKDRLGPSFFPGRSKAWICPGASPIFASYLNTYMFRAATAPATTNPDGSISDNAKTMDIVKTTTFDNYNSSTTGMGWVWDNIKYDAAVPPGFNTDKSPPVFSPAMYPHTLNGKGFINTLYVNGVVKDDR